jgi:hypothetical protein
MFLKQHTEMQSLLVFFGGEGVYWAAEGVVANASRTLSFSYGRRRLFDVD